LTPAYEDFSTTNGKKYIAKEMLLAKFS